MDIRQESLAKHYEWAGKIEVTARTHAKSRKELSLAYTPGVAEPCVVIQKNPEEVWKLTRRWNTVAVITDGTAVLGLGDIGPEAGMPVMEGKCLLFKEFAGIDAIPLCIRSKDPDEIVNTVRLLCGSFGGVNLEDISAPRCFEIERRLRECCDIPVFHDDQHGTAIIVSAAMLNACRVVKKDISEISVVINGAGAAGLSIGKMLRRIGVTDLTYVDKNGVLYEGREDMNPAQAAEVVGSNKSGVRGYLADAVKGKDAFIGVSAANVLSEDMVRSMAAGPIIFAMANPNPEIMPDKAKAAGAAVVQRSWRRRAPGEGSGSVSYSFRVEVGCQQPRTGLFHKNTKLTTQINKTGTIKTHTLRFILVIIIVFQRDNTLEKSTSGFGRVSVRLSAIVSKIKHSES